MTDSGGNDLGAVYYQCCNRGKRSVAIDVAAAEGQERVRALANAADILIENFKVGGLSRYSLDAPTLSARNPRLI